MKNKNNTTLTVEAEITLMPFLLEKLKDKNRNNIKSLLRNKQVWINGKSVSQFNHPLKAGESIEIRNARAGDLPPEKFMSLVFEDDSIVVIDKMAGLLSVTDGYEQVTAFGLLSEWVMKQDASAKIYIVHRLDQYTSGLLLFVKNEEIQNDLRNNWKSFITERTYAAVVEGEVKKDKGTIKSYLSENKALTMVSGQDPSQGKFAITHYKTINRNPAYSLLHVTLDTGRKNQIRVHMKDIGHPVAGDRKYGARTNPVGRLCLHAAILAFRHPVTGESMRFESKVPGEFLRLVEERKDEKAREKKISKKSAGPYGKWKHK